MPTAAELLNFTADLTWARIGENSGPKLVAAPYARLVVELFRSEALTALRDAYAYLGQHGQYMPLLLALRDGDTEAQIQRLRDAGIAIDIAPAYIAERRVNPSFSHVAARLELREVINEPDGEQRAARLRKMLEAITAHIRRLDAPARLLPSAAALPFRGASSSNVLDDIGVPADRKFDGHELVGRDVVVGIIDDGCAFAHPNFINVTHEGKLESRIKYLWDQSVQSREAPWTALLDFFEGHELTDPAITAVLNKHWDKDLARVNDTAVYADLQYDIPDFASHGTHVMDIAAGNGKVALRTEGVAPGADIVFVQLPRDAIGEGAPALANWILDGVLYIFARARKLGKPAVVNISYGGYAGPHDGSSLLETALDELLALPDRAIVVAAGNGLEAACHASGAVKAGRQETLGWVILPLDPTLNLVEVWYPGDAVLSVTLIPPDGSARYDCALGTRATALHVAGSDAVLGTIDHDRDPGNGEHHVVITLGNTADEASSVLAGEWKIELGNRGDRDVPFDAWIERDDSGQSRNARRQQSRFADGDANALCSLSGLATGTRTISVGAYNTATQELCRYSAAGPSRQTAARDALTKPEVCAPAETDIAGRGILSASSRSGQPTPMNGTSAAAPHVAGVIALMFEKAKSLGVTLDAAAIRDKLMVAAHRASGLAGNRRHDQLSPGTPNLAPGGRDVPSEARGAGKLNANVAIEGVGEH